MVREISGSMRKHQLQLADRQCRMSELSLRVQNLVTMLVTAIYAGRQQDELLQAAGDVACHGFATQADARTPQRCVFPHRDEAGGQDRRQRVRADRRHPTWRDSQTV